MSFTRSLGRVLEVTTVLPECGKCKKIQRLLQILLDFLAISVV